MTEPLKSILNRANTTELTARPSDMAAFAAALEPAGPSPQWMCYPMGSLRDSYAKALVDAEDWLHGHPHDTVTIYQSVSVVTNQLSVVNIKA